MERFFGILIYMIGFLMLVVTLIDALELARWIEGDLIENDLWMVLFMVVGYFLSVIGFIFNRRSSMVEESLIGIAIDDWMGLLMFGLGLALILLSFFYALGWNQMLDPWGQWGVPVFVAIGIVLCITGFAFAGATISSMVGRSGRRY